MSLLLAGGGSLVTQSAEARQDAVPGSRYTSARAAALGDAYLPLADDPASALFYNPAGLGKIKQFTFEPANIKAHVNTDFTRNVGLGTYKFTNLSNYQSELGNNPWSFPGAGVSLLPNLGFRGFGLGLLADYDVAASNQDGNIHYRTRNQIIPAVGGGIRLASGVIRLGYSLQWVNQAYGDVTVSGSTSPLGYNRGLVQGSGLSHNAGFALTLPFRFLPSLNLVARNIFGTSYKSFTLINLARDPVGVPADDPMTFDGAVSIHGRITDGAAINLVAQYRDITNRSELSPLLRAAVGLEFTFRDLFFIRTGIGSGYPSAGIGFRRSTGDFSLSWYSEELGSGLWDYRDTKFVMHYQVRAF